MTRSTRSWSRGREGRRRRGGFIDSHIHISLAFNDLESNGRQAEPGNADYLQFLDESPRNIQYSGSPGHMFGIVVTQFQPIEIADEVPQQQFFSYRRLDDRAVFKGGSQVVYLRVCYPQVFKEPMEVFQASPIHQNRLIPALFVPVGGP